MSPSGLLRETLGDKWGACPAGNVAEKAIGPSPLRWDVDERGRRRTDRERRAAAEAGRAVHGIVPRMPEWIDGHAVVVIGLEGF